MHHLIDIHLFLRGLMIGFIIALPVGPVGILCLRRTFHYGRLSGLVSGLGAVTIDMIYATIAIFGLTFFADIVIQHRDFLHIFGVILLTFIGWKIFFSQPQGKNLALDHRGLIHEREAPRAVPMSTRMAARGWPATLGATLENIPKSVRSAPG